MQLSMIVFGNFQFLVLISYRSHIFNEWQMGWDGFNRQRWIEITSTTYEETVFKKHMQGVVVSSKIRYL